MSRQQIDFPVQQHHIATPPPPPAGALKLYPKSDNVLYKLTSAGVESAVGVIPDPLVVNNATVNQVLTVGQRIKGDFSNATHASRVMLQTTATDASTIVGVLPSGTGAVGQLNLYNSSALTNVSMAQLYVSATEVRLQTGTLGTGTSLPLTFYAYGQERGRMDSISTNWNTPQDVRINSNVYYDGAAWTRFDTVNPLSHINLGRGTFNYYNAVAGAGAPAWVPRLTIATDGVITIGNSNARIWSYGVVDPNAAGEMLVGINALTVTPGTLHTARIQCNGPFTATGAATLNGGLTVASMTATGTITTNAINTVDWFRIGGGTSGLYNSVQGVGIYFPGAVPAAYPSGNRFLTVADWSTSYNADQAVLRYSGGNVQFLSAYMPSGAQGGVPAYICGQNGDGWLRWWPKSVMDAPALNWAQLTTTAPASNQGAWQNCTFSGSGNAYCRNDSSQMTPLKAAYFSIFANGGGYYAVGVRIVVDGVVVASNTGNSNDYCPCGTGWTGYVGSWVQVHRYGGVGQGAATFHMTYVPSGTYP